MNRTVPLKSILTALLVSTFFCSLESNASAMTQEAPFSLVALGADVGTYGPGILMSTDLAPGVNLNAGFSHFSYSANVRADNLNFKGRLNLGGESVTLTIFPFVRSGFDIDAGLVVNQNEVKAHGIPVSSDYIVDHTDYYTAAEIGSVSGQTNFRKIDPYIGIGWGNPVGDDGRWTFLADLGVIYQGSPNLSLSNQGGSAIPAVAEEVYSARKYLDRKAQWMHWYPVFSIGIAYRL